MFCNYCGSSNPDDFLFCAHCGRARKIGGGTPAGTAPASAPSVDGKRGSVIGATLSWFGSLFGRRRSLKDDPSQAARNVARQAAKVKWLYAAYISELLLAGFLLALTVFPLVVNVFDPSTHGAGEKGGQAFLGLIALLLSARRTWQEILKHESGSSYAKKHRAYNAVLALVLGAAVLTSGILGSQAGSRSYRDAALKALVKRADELQPAHQQFRAELAKIRGADVRTFEDYHNNCLKLEALLDGWEPVRREDAALFAEVTAELARSARDRPDMAEVAVSAKSVHEMDDQIIGLLRSEISHSKKLVEQPPHKQEAYYKHHIEPIQAEIAKLGDQESRLLKQAQQRGIKLPPDLAEALR